MPTPSNTQDITNDPMAQYQRFGAFAAGSLRGRTSANTNSPKDVKNHMVTPLLTNDTCTG